MKKNVSVSFKKISFVIMNMFVFSIFSAFCMGGFNALGGSESGIGGSITYSVMELAYENSDDTQGSLSIGLQQPLEISVVIGIKEFSGIDLKVAVYPIPTKDILTLSIEDVSLMDLSYVLYDMQGTHIKKAIITDNTTSLDMTGQSKGVYFLEIQQTKQVIKTFKIIKH